MDFNLQIAMNCTNFFAQASGLGCALTEEGGQVLHACGQDYSRCRVCELAGRGPERCRQAHQYGAREAERFGGKYIYFCAMGLTFFTSPIIGAEGMQARITVGPFLMVDEQDYAAYDLSEVAGVTPERITPIMNEVRNLPYVEARRVTAFSELLFMAVAFMNNLAQSSRMLDNEHSARMQGQISDYLFRLKKGENAAPYPYRTEQRLLQMIGRGDRQQAQELLNELLGHIMFAYGGDAGMIRHRVHELLTVISRKAIDVGCDPAYIDECMVRFRRREPQDDTVEGLCLWMSKTIRSLMDELFVQNRARHSDLIHHGLSYLQSNYAKKISLEDAAASVHVSPSYLSRVFKRETGVSMVDTLNRIRIEKSKELLMDEGVRMIEVAMQCGFESQSYFNRMFKQFCDMTPQQYRKRMLGGPTEKDEPSAE